MSNICILIIIGIPGSGKSTLCKYFIAASEPQKNKNTEIVHFCYDELSKKLKYNNYKVFRHQAFELVEYNLKLIPRDDNRKYIIIIDDTMHLSSMRKMYYNMCQKYCISFCEVYLQVDVSTALERNLKRPKEEIMKTAVILDIKNKLEPPGERWETHYCIINSKDPLSQQTVDKIWETINSSMATPFEVLEMPKPEIEIIVNERHTVDLILRKFISNRICELKEQNPETNISIIGKQLSLKKKEFMEQKKFDELDLGQPDSEELIKLLFQDFIS